jgi:hypothetical protein
MAMPLSLTGCVRRISPVRFAGDIMSGGPFLMTEKTSPAPAISEDFEGWAALLDPTSRTNLGGVKAAARPGGRCARWSVPWLECGASVFSMILRDTRMDPGAPAVWIARLAGDQGRLGCRAQVRTQGRMRPPS